MFHNVHHKLAIQDCLTEMQMKQFCSWFVVLFCCCLWIWCGNSCLMYKLSQTVSLAQSTSTNFIKYFRIKHTFCARSLSKMKPTSQFLFPVACSMFPFTEWIHNENFIRIYRHFLQTRYLAHTICHAEIRKAIVHESQKPWNLSDKQRQNKPLRVVGLYSTSDQMLSDQP